MLEAKNLSFSYEKKSDSRKILEDVTLSVGQGERVGILAPSGAGKTTLLKILGGYLLPDSGCVLVDGQPLPKKGHCPVQLIWQHPEKAVNPRLRLEKTLAEASAGKDAGGGRTGESGTGAPPGHSAGMEKPFSPGAFRRRAAALLYCQGTGAGNEISALRRDQHHAGSDYPRPDLAVFDGRDGRKKNRNGDHKPQPGASGSCLHQADPAR